MDIEELQRDPCHYVPFMTGYETDQPFIAACGRDVTCGFFYTSLHTFIGMPAVVPIRRCHDCEDMVGAGAVLGALMALLALSTPSRAPERRLRPSGSCTSSPQFAVASP